MYNKEQLKKTLENKGYKWFNDDNNKTFDVNIISIRTKGNKITNMFDDYITISFKNEKNEWTYYEFPCTTDPGTYYMKKKLLSKDGCARLVEGQYRGSHCIGMHQSKYLALVQQKPLKTYRDANLDDFYNEDKITEGYYGINIHKAGTDSLKVDNYSAGCTVFKRVKDFNLFMEICTKAKSIHGNSFTYTILKQEDIL